MAVNACLGVKPLIHQSELVVPFHFVVLWKLLNVMD